MTQRYLEDHPGDFPEICIAEADKGSFETMASKHCRRTAAEEAAVSPNWSMSTEVPLQKWGCVHYCVVGRLKGVKSYMKGSRHTTANTLEKCKALYMHKMISQLFFCLYEDHCYGIMYTQHTQTVT